MYGLNEFVQAVSNFLQIIIT